MRALIVSRIWMRHRACWRCLDQLTDSSFEGVERGLALTMLG